MSDNTFLDTLFGAVGYTKKSEPKSDGAVRATSIYDPFAPPVSGDTNFGYFDAWDKTAVKDRWKYSEDTFFGDYNRLYITNPYCTFVVNYLQAELIGNGFHAEGEGADEVNEFFKKDETVLKVTKALHDAILYGSGYMDISIYRRGRTASRTRVIPASTVGITFDKKTGIRKYSQPSYNVPRIPENRIMHFYMKERPGIAYPMSLLRPNFDYVRGLDSASQDIFTVIERVGYSPIVTKLNLNDFADNDAKESVVNNFKAKMKATQSARQNFVIDEKHSMELLGGGRNSAQLLNSEELLQLHITTVLLNFGVPIGYFLQEGSNRSILDQQREGVRNFINLIRRQLTSEMEKKLLPRITGKDCRIVWDDGFRDWVDKAKMWQQLYIAGLVSQERTLDELNIIDEGDTFFEGQQQQRLEINEYGRENQTGTPQSD